MTDPLPVCRADQLPSQEKEFTWLIRRLWTGEAVGVIGGEPKCCKSFMALGLGVSIATGSPCLRRFHVDRPGRVLLFAAEDALHLVRDRLEGICRASGVTLAGLDLHVITAPSIRLDLPIDRGRLARTVEALRPRLLILDPFVRMHQADENASGDVARLLGFLRQLQRDHGTAVVVVHHARKGGASLRAGQALRGSGEFHAWGDSFLYLRRRGNRLLLAAEHRAAEGLAGISLELVERPDGARALEIVEENVGMIDADVDVDAPEARQIETALARAAGPMSHGELLRSCKVRKSTFCRLLRGLIDQGRVLKAPDGYTLNLEDDQDRSVPVPAA